MSKKLGKIVVGILIAACGACIGAQAAGLLPGGLSTDGWWTVFLIVPGLLLLACVGLNAFDVLLTGLGVLFLLDEQGVLRGGLGYRLAIPYGLVVIGLALVFCQRKQRGFVPSSSGVFAGTGEQSCYAVGGSNTPQLKGSRFSGTRGVAAFGTINLDLREAALADESVVRLCVVFGAANIALPENALLMIRSFPVFGGVKNAFVPTAGPDAPLVIVRLVSVFGGVHIQ